MTIRHLQIFKMVCDCGSITVAADKLNITQPSVSIAIKELESFYNAQLFDRINRKIYLTEAGDMLRQYANTILEQYNEATTILREKENFSRIIIGANSSISETFLPKLLQEAKEKIPHFNPTIFIHNNEIIEQKLSNNNIDFAILDRVKDSKTKKSLLLCTDEMSIICSPDFYESDTITIKELSKHPLLMREVGSGLRNCVDEVFSKHGCITNAIVESTSTISLIELAENGMGFSFISNELAQKIYKYRKIKIVSLSDDNFKRHYYLIYNNKKHLTPIMKQFIDLI